MAGNAPRNETQQAYHRRRMRDLMSIRSPWESLWQSLAEHIEPTRYRQHMRQEGPVSRDKIIDSTGTFAWKTLASGMHSGITSPARPWFRLTTFDPDMKDYGPVKEYLAQVEQRLREVFQKSNLYPAFHTGYGDIGQFGQSCSILAEDDENTIRMQPLLHGTFWIARDERGVATTLYRKFRWSVQRIVGRFGYANCSHPIQSAYDQSRYDQTFDICHAIEPRMDRDPAKADKANKPFLSNYWEDLNGNEGKLLEESGFDENPIIAPPWELAGDDSYAVSPGMIALGDIKMLQLEQTRKLEGIDKIVRPPMTGPTSMRNNPASLLPGAVTYVDDPTGGGFRPAMQVNLRLSELAADIGDTQERIRQAFYADLFLMISNMEGVQPRNNMEIAERKEEKLLALGPVLENIYNGQLAPVIDRTYAIMNRRDGLPPPPPELQDKDLQIEYISMLAQAQKAVSTGSIERVMGFAGQFVGVKNDILDKIDFDEAIDQYAGLIGSPPSIIVPDDKVKEKRDDRARADQAKANAEMAKTVAPAVSAGADAARLMSEAGSAGGGAGLLQQLGIG